MTVEKILKATDNTGKISVKLRDGSVIECVLLEDQTGRVTACISCQSGCAQGCLFCKTGTLGLKRNLTKDEIVFQLDLLKKSFSRNITNIVYMGMGEPFHNMRNVLSSVREFTNPKTYNIFLRRITISTSGAIQSMPELLKQAPYPGLAFSLITADQRLRSKLMPKTPDLITIKKSLMEYQKICRKRIIIEIINFDGINETKKEADSIKIYLNGLDVIVNLIPYNHVKGLEFKEPNMKKVEEFSKYLFNSGLKVTIRHGKGQEISGACGQLGQV